MKLNAVLVIVGPALGGSVTITTASCTNTCE